MVERRFLRLDSLTPRLFADATMPGNSPVCSTDLRRSALDARPSTLDLIPP
jgi:hypothetical protein